MREESERNRERWNELAPLHASSRFYDLDGFRKGGSSLLPVELEELGDVAGKNMLHLQCHIGIDSLSWARKGAKVTGVDYSAAALEIARDLAKETDLDAEFVLSDVLDLPDHLEGDYDIVFTSYGVLCWLPDLKGWAKVVAHFLKPGGVLYLVEDHPLAQLIDEYRSGDVVLSYPYFTSGKPTRFEVKGSYVDREAKVVNTTTYEWTHTVGDLMNAVIDAGLRLEFVHEFPFGFYERHPDMIRESDGIWRFKDEKRSLPLLLSLKARKPA